MSLFSPPAPPPPPSLPPAPTPPPMFGFGGQAQPGLKPPKKSDTTTFLGAQLAPNPTNTGNKTLLGM